MRSKAELRVLYALAPDARSLSMQAPTRPAGRTSALNRFLIDRTLPSPSPSTSTSTTPTTLFSLRDSDGSRQLVHGWDHLPQAAYLIACRIHRGLIVEQNFFSELHTDTRRFLVLPISVCNVFQPGRRAERLTHRSLLAFGCGYLAKLCIALPEQLAGRLKFRLDSIEAGIAGGGLAAALLNPASRADSSLSHGGACESVGLDVSCNAGERRPTLPAPGAPDKSLISFAIAYAKKYPHVLPACAG